MIFKTTLPYFDYHRHQKISPTHNLTASQFASADDQRAQAANFSFSFQLQLSLVFFLAVLCTQVTRPGTHSRRVGTLQSPCARAFRRQNAFTNHFMQSSFGWRTVTALARRRNKSLQPESIDRREEKDTEAESRVKGRGRKGRLRGESLV